MRHRPEIRNFAWLLGEYGIRVVLQLAISAAIARHLGPSDFGTYGLFYGLITLVLPLTDAGLNHLVSREVAAGAQPLPLILGTSLAVRLGACAIGVPLLGILAVAAGPDHQSLVGFAILAAVLNCLSGFAVIDYYFQSQLAARLSAIARISSIGLLTAGQFTAIAAGHGVETFLIALALQQPLFGATYYILFRVTGGPTVREWRLSRSYARYLITRSGRLLFANVLGGLSTRLPLLVLSRVGNAASLGLLAAATRPIEMAGIVPNAITSTIFPRMVRARRESAATHDALVSRVSWYFIVAGAFAALLIALAAPTLTDLLYGDEFAGAVSVMRIYACTMFFVPFRAFMSKWILTEERYSLSVKSHGLGVAASALACIGIILPSPSASAAAIALLIHAAAGSFGALALFSDGRPLLRLAIRQPLAWGRNQLADARRS